MIRHQTEYDNINNWIDTLTNLETVLQDYSNYDSFLEIIEDNADGDLKEAASSMRNSMRKMLLGCILDNNASECAIRGFCIGKKNWEMIEIER